MSLKCLLSLGALLALACSKPEPPKPPPTAVTVGAAVEQNVIEWDDYSGHLESPNVVTLAARVSGIITSAPFEEGSLVHSGDTLYTIDDRPFLADLASKRANVERAQAQLAQAQVHFNRYSKIRETRAISAEDYDQAVASLKQAQAELAAAKAAEDSSKLNLEWTKVTAPITGRISRKLVTTGNQVTGGSGQATQLTVLTSVDPLYASVTVPESAFLRYQKLGEELNRGIGSPPKMPCSFRLEGEKAFRDECVLNFIDSRVDPNTGTVLLRGTVTNADGKLTPGLFMRMRVRASMPYNALLVPDSAVSTDQNGRILLVVGANNTAEQRKVALGPLFGRMRAITDGLKLGEKFVTNGISNVRPGAALAPQEAAVPPELLASIEPFLAPSAEGRAAPKISMESPPETPAAPTVSPATTSTAVKR